jgi:Na+/proline symporter
MGQRYGSDFLRIAFALLSLLLIYYIAAQIVAAATMFQVLLDFSYVTDAMANLGSTMDPHDAEYRIGILLSVGVIALYIGMGGTHADIMTDGVQGVMMVAIAFAIAVLFVMSPGVEGTGPAAINAALVEQDPTLGWDNYFIPGDPIFANFWLIVLLFIAHLPFAMNPHVGKLAFALKDPKQIRRFMLIAIPIGSVLGFTVLGGLHARALVGPEIRPDAAIPVLFTELFPPFIAGLLGVGILSAIMSTSDGLFIAIAVIFSNDLYKRTLAPIIHKHKSEQEIDRVALIISRVAIVVVAIAAMALAWHPPKFLAVLLWIGVGGIVAGAAGPLLIGSMWRRATKAGAITSFLTGVILYAVLITKVYEHVISYDIGLKSPFSIAGACIILASVVMVVVSLLTKPLPQQLIDRVFGEKRVAG